MNARLRKLFLLWMCCLLPLSAWAQSDDDAVASDQVVSKAIVIGSKHFGENHLLGEITAQLFEQHGYSVVRKLSLGGTLICYQALRAEEIDVYVEYTGTLSQAVLDLPTNSERQQINRALQADGLELLAELGFNNTYALAVREAHAQRLGLRSIADLKSQPEMRLAFSHEFMQRGDGWPGLAAAYGLPQKPTGIEHGLAYQAIADGAIDGTDAYSTDGELRRYRLRTLTDDLGYFPTYRAAPLVRADTAPAIRSILGSLADTLDEATIQTLNAQVVVDGLSFQTVANSFLSERAELFGLSRILTPESSWQQELLGHFLRHIYLTVMALGAAIVVGLGLSLAVYQRGRLAKAVVYSCGLMQTIPSLALLALLIPFMGIGVAPAVLALFLYSLLPIVRNSVTALAGTDPTLVRVSMALGLTPAQQLRHLRLPLAMPAIFAGVRTAAVISIGTATLAAFIGAGGLGEPIVVGLSLNDPDMILRGAIPAALLAILVELIFEAVERRVVPRV